MWYNGGVRIQWLKRLRQTIRKKKLAVTHIILTALALQLMWIIPCVLVPALEQSKMIETLNHMLYDITLCEEYKNYEGALSICEEAYKITYGIKNEKDRKNYQK